MSAEDSALKTALDKAVVTNFAGGMLTLTFKSTFMANMLKDAQQKFEQKATQVANQAIKLSVIVDKNLPPPVLNNMPEPDRTNLAGAMETFNASDAIKLND